MHLVEFKDQFGQFWIILDLDGISSNLRGSEWNLSYLICSDFGPSWDTLNVLLALFDYL